MHYVSVEEARHLPGLRLVLTAGMPGPWGEAAKAVFSLKNLSYTAVFQEGAGENEALREWTGQVSAPVVVYNDEEPCCSWESILFFAERMAPEPALLPEDCAQRARVFGYLREIAGQQGFGWQRRMMMIQAVINHTQGQPPENTQRIMHRYHYREAEAKEAPQRAMRILEALAALLHEQRARGVPYFIGDSLGALDVYWAAFSNMYAPLPAELNPMPEQLRALHEVHGPPLSEADPILLEHRDRMFRDHLQLPLDFLVDS